MKSKCKGLRGTVKKLDPWKVDRETMHRFEADAFGLDGDVPRFVIYGAWRRSRVAAEADGAWILPIAEDVCEQLRAHRDRRDS